MELFDVYSLYDLEPTHGKGARVFTADKREILDFYGGHAVISIGHSHPHFVAAISRQAEKLAFYSNSVRNPLQETYARKLGEMSGMEDYRLFLCNSGAEANENALKLASFYNGRRRVLAFRGAFHGRTSAAVNATDNDKIKASINKGYPVTFLELGDIAGVEKELARGDVAALIVEGIQGIGGVYVPDAEFLRALPRLCHAHDTVLILDEIQSGFGRSGKFFAFQHAGIEPDIVSMAKGMGNGFPIGGILIHPRFAATRGMLGTTFGGNHLACAAGLAVLEVMEQEQLVENSAKLGTWLKSALKKGGWFREVRGLGLMIGLQLDEPVADLRKKLLFQQHVFTGSASDPATIRLLPPLCINQQDSEELLNAIRLEIKQLR